MFKIGIIKTGNIASSLVLELLLDERADRKDIQITVVTSGAKMSFDEIQSPLESVLNSRPDLLLYCTPNPSAPVPGRVIDRLAGRKAIIVGDAPGARIADKLKELKLGYVFIKADSMIGARREFLDPTEMAAFNAEMLKVLSFTGVIRLLQEEIGKAVDELKKGGSYLPRVIVDSTTAVKYSGISNPYARSKAIAAYEIAEKVGSLTAKGCFAEKAPENYIPLIASAHELLRAASHLADEAREIEKGSDSILRSPHSPDGKILRKRKLMEKQSKEAPF